MSNCPSCTGENPQNLPPLLSPNNGLSSCNPSRLSDIRSNQYNIVEWPNVTNISTPTDLIDHEYTHGLADINAEKIPENFNWLNKNKEVENGHRNQELCGCCWAMATSTVLGDRFAIKYNITNPYLSPGWLASCGNKKFPPNAQCTCGGNTSLAAKWCEEKGINTEVCWPFKDIVKASLEYNTSCNKSCKGCKSNIYPCPLDYNNKNCADGCKQNYHIFKAKPNSTKLLVKFKSEEGTQIDAESTTRAIQQEILNNGPVIASFMVPKSFMKFWKENSLDDVYTPDTTDTEGGHAISLIGWGKDSKTGKRYWLLRNSWGLTHSGHGYCKFAFSLDTNGKYWSGIDIPLQIGTNNGVETAQGGVVVLEPDKIPDSYKPTPGSPPGSPLGSPPGPSKKSGLSAGVISGIVIGIILFLILIIIGFLYFKKYK